MKHSIKNQFAMIFIALMTGTILLCWFLNSTLLEKYYTSNKQNVLLTAYHNINEATSKGNSKNQVISLINNNENNNYVNFYKKSKGNN